MTGAAYADTAVDPPDLVVPGNAAPAVDGAPVTAPSTPRRPARRRSPRWPQPTKVRVDAREPATASVDLSPIYRIHTVRASRAG